MTLNSLVCRGPLLANSILKTESDEKHEYSSAVMNQNEFMCELATLDMNGYLSQIKRLK